MSTPTETTPGPLLPGQFVLLEAARSAAAQERLPGWSLLELPGGWTLLSAPDAPVRRLVGPEGEHLGALIGAALPGAGLDLGGDDEAVWTGASSESSALRALRGSWLAIVQRDGGLSLQPDPVASVPVVFTVSGDAAGSTPTAIATALGGALPPAADRYEQAELDSDCWYPFGLCPQAELLRLLPNHELPLGAPRARRVHPPAPAHVLPEEEALAALERALRSAFEDLPGQLSVPLTAGRDSRLVLACALAAGHAPQTFTLSSGAPSTDLSVASRVAAAAGVPHQVHRLQLREGGSIDTWYERTGLTVGGRNQQFVRPAASQPPGELELSGSGGETMRGFYWRGTAAPSLPEARVLSRHLGLPEKARFPAAAAGWLEDLADLPTDVALDLAYVELRMGCWAGPQLYGRLRPHTQFFGFGQAEVVDAMARLPHELRVTGRAADLLVPRLAPALEGLPFNQGTAWARLRERAALLGSPRYLLRKLRQKLG